MAWHHRCSGNVVAAPLRNSIFFLSSLNGPLYDVTVVVVRRYQLVRHAQLSDLVLVVLGDFVVEDLVRRRDVLLCYSY